MSETSGGKIFTAMIAAMADVDAVGKDRTNSQQGFKFRGIDDVYNVVHAALSKHGIVTPPRVLERTSCERLTKSGATQIHVTLKVEYDFTASDGSKMVVGPVYAEALDTSDKATNKAMSFAHKYTLLQTFSIPTADVSEGDKVTIDAGTSVVLPPKSQAERLKEAIKAKAPPRQEEEPPPPTEEDYSQAPQEEITPEGDFGPEIPFGKNKGKRASQLSRKSLEWYIERARESVRDPSKEKFKAKNEAYLQGLEDVHAAMQN